MEFTHVFFFVRQSSDSVQINQLLKPDLNLGKKEVSFFFLFERGIDFC